MTSVEQLASLLLTDVDHASADAVTSLAASLRTAAEAYPQLPAPDAPFVDSVRERVPEANADEVLALSFGELLIAYHSATGHPAALREVRARLDTLRGPLRRTGASAGEIEQLLNDLPSDLVGPRPGGAPRILGYSGRGSLHAWLRVVAVRTMVERRRKQGLVIDDDAVAEAATPELSPELGLLRKQYAVEFREAFANAVTKLPAADRTMLRQHHVDGVSLDALARLYGVHRATIARRLASTREIVVLEVRRDLIHRLRIGTQTVDSIIRIVHNELDVSIIRFL